MSNSRAAGWPADGPSAAQLKEFFAQIDSGRIKHDNFQEYLKSNRPPEVKQKIRGLINSERQWNEFLRFLTVLFLVAGFIGGTIAGTKLGEMFYPVWSEPTLLNSWPGFVGAALGTGVGIGIVWLLGKLGRRAFSQDAKEKS